VLTQLLCAELSPADAVAANVLFVMLGVDRRDLPRETHLLIFLVGRLTDFEWELLYEAVTDLILYPYRKLTTGMCVLHAWCCRCLQNATLAGGVAMGSSAALRLSPGGAVAVGLFAGTLSTFGFGWLAGVLEQKLNLGDTCGVHVSPLLACWYPHQHLARCNGTRCRTLQRSPWQKPHVANCIASSPSDVRS
jgi:hypothetical protein